MEPQWFTAFLENEPCRYAYRKWHQRFVARSSSALSLNWGHGKVVGRQASRFSRRMLLLFQSTPPAKGFVRMLRPSFSKSAIPFGQSFQSICGRNRRRFDRRLLRHRDCGYQAEQDNGRQTAEREKRDGTAVQTTHGSLACVRNWMISRGARVYLKRIESSSDSDPVMRSDGKRSHLYGGGVATTGPAGGQTGRF